MKLFAVYLGGRARGCNIELHDVVFIIGTSIEATYPRLIKKWFGFPDKPHIDSYIELKHIDGFEIRLLPSPPESPSMHKLFFVNFGAYTEHLFGEIHQSAFYVAKDRPHAIKKAHAHLCTKMIQTHCDDNLEVEGLMKEDNEYEVDDVIELDAVDGYYLEFIPMPIPLTSLPVPGYRKLVKDKTL